MEKGVYTGRRVDFTKFAASCFNPFLFTGYVRSLVGCGASALSLLTGIPPESIAAHKRGAHYSDDFMLRFLRRRQFRVLPLTQCNVSVSASRIGTNHVLLLSQLYRENEGTWIVVYDAQCYHNFDVYALDRFSFINKPVLTAYIVVHPRWQKHNDHTVASTQRPKAKKGGATLSDLRNAGLIAQPSSTMSQTALKT